MNLAEMQARKAFLDRRAIQRFISTPACAIPKSLTWRIAHPHVDSRSMREQTKGGGGYADAEVKP